MPGGLSSETIGAASGGTFEYYYFSITADMYPYIVYGTEFTSGAGGGLQVGLMSAADFANFQAGNAFVFYSEYAAAAAAPSRQKCNDGGGGTTHCAPRQEADSHAPAAHCCAVSTT